MILFWGSKLQLWFMSHGGLQMCKCIYTYTCSEKVKALSMSPRKLVFQSERKKKLYVRISYTFFSVFVAVNSHVVYRHNDYHTNMPSIMYNYGANMTQISTIPDNLYPKSELLFRVSCTQKHSSPKNGGNTKKVCTTFKKRT